MTNEEFDDFPPATNEHDHLKVKVASCPTCGGWIFQSAFPLCETSKDSQKEFRACIKAGLTIDVITLGEAKKLEYCPQSHGKKKPAHADLFTAHAPAHV
jgi:hypothetical protein